MPRPESLPIPPISAYQFINFRLWYSSWFEVGGDSSIIISHQYDQTSWKFDDDNHRIKFSSPELVPSNYARSISLMNDNTFEALIGRSSYYIEEFHIGTKSDLSSIASKKPDLECDEIDYRRATHAQAEAFLLKKASDEALYHWGKIAELYNNSSDDQKEAIFQFFSNFLNRDISDLYGMPGPEPLPEHLQPKLEEKFVDDMRMVFSEFDNEWKCDHIAAHKFTVSGYRESAKSNHHNRQKTYIIACATTLEEAVAYATRYAIEIDPKDSKERLAIDYENKEICSGKILSHTQRPSFEHVLPVRLSWEIDKKASIPEARIHKALLDIEKKMGVKWTKVKTLEDELGL